MNSILPPRFDERRFFEPHREELPQRISLVDVMHPPLGLSAKRAAVTTDSGKIDAVTTMSASMHPVKLPSERESIVGSIQGFPRGDISLNLPIHEGSFGSFSSSPTEKDITPIHTTSDDEMHLKIEGANCGTTGHCLKSKDSISCGFPQSSLPELFDPLSQHPSLYPPIPPHSYGNSTMVNTTVNPATTTSEFSVIPCDSTPMLPQSPPTVIGASIPVGSNHKSKLEPSPSRKSRDSQPVPPGTTIESEFVIQYSFLLKSLDDTFHKFKERGIDPRTMLTVTSIMTDTVERLTDCHMTTSADDSIMFNRLRQRVRLGGCDCGCDDASLGVSDTSRIRTRAQKAAAASGISCSSSSPATSSSTQGTASGASTIGHGAADLFDDDSHSHSHGGGKDLHSSPTSSSSSSPSSPSTHVTPGHCTCDASARRSTFSQTQRKMMNCFINKGELPVLNETVVLVSQEAGLEDPKQFRRFLNNQRARRRTKKKKE
ncbi:hypothetical protein ADUPG1_013526 [Aduncisulcus paluster]|uniref:Homeobox domain-containing protein n=1 Tax=Aduncisulcus paluster TaxID=2918883 RepID=A0ABQ5K6V4_9EUKA|nr:hypothetical protein ADUPG1_013526 [Aduncisulcus paluster]